MAGQKRTVASDKTQQQLPQGNALVNAGGISSLISSSLQPHRPHQSHQSPYPYSSAAYPIHQALQSTGASGAPTGHPSTGASPPSLSRTLPTQLFQEQEREQEQEQEYPQLEARSQNRVPNPRRGPVAVPGPGPGPGNPKVLAQASVS